MEIYKTHSSVRNFIPGIYKIPVRFLEFPRVADILI